MLVDSHCHLDFPDFEKDLSQVVDRAVSKNVIHFLTICTHISKFQQVRNVTEKYKEIMDCSIGIHPHEADNEEAVDKNYLINRSKNDPKIIAFGETGLDFYYDNSPREIQERQFRTHIAASRETDIPVIIHTRNADEKTSQILEEEMEKGAFRGVIHCFSSGDSLALKAIDLGLYISLSGIITFKKSDDLRQIVKKLPLERILVETDAPFLAPVPNRGKRNEPAFVENTAIKLAEIHDKTLDDIAKITTNNFYDLFSKANKSF